MKKRFPLLLCILVLLCLGVFVCALLFGSVRLGPGQLAAALAGGGRESIILFELRLPRAVAAGLAGVGLATAGLLLQTVTGNGLCAPNIIGVNAGAGCAVMIFLCFAPMHYSALPAAAFFGALLTALAVLAMSSAGAGRFEKSTLVLAGVAVGALLNAVISFLALRYPDVLSAYSAFSVGGFRGVELSQLALPGLVTVLGFALALLLSGRLKILLLGDDMARSLGLRAGALRLCSVVIASALCAAVVSYAGLLGFVGLAVPHISRMLCGQDIRRNLVVTALLGWLLVIAADLAGRLLFAPTELPAGVITALLGGPFFLYLLLRKRRL